ncbi:MAG: Type I Iterative PKS [Watsoniomyces obsoletus]|nr:MAG: Type I Iterative PKS [Watsoniomyces obsoletus]
MSRKPTIGPAVISLAEGDLTAVKDARVGPYQWRDGPPGTDVGNQAISESQHTRSADRSPDMRSTRKMGSARRIVLFGGQGSSSLFSPPAAATASLDAHSSPVAAELLSKCHAALLSELQVLTEDPLKIIEGLVEDFITPEKLLAPGSAHRENPIIQGTTICLYQLLRYLAEVQGNEAGVEHVFPELLEVTGFCSGLLPATVVASSRTAREFIEFGVAAYRLSFWIGYRSSSYCQDLLGRRWKDLPWSLVLTGIDRSQVSQALDTFHNKHGHERLHIAALNSELCTSISGPGRDLVAFKAHCADKCSATSAPIHTLYHGGPDLDVVVQEVCNDVKSQHISFPSWNEMRTPIRSTLDGKYLSSNHTTLVEALLPLLLVHPVDWCRTSEHLSRSVVDFLEKNSSTTVQAVSYGPQSGLLLSDIKRRQAALPRLTAVDLSQSAKSSEPSSSDMSNAIAIVGMGAHFPKGHGVDELWETISNGLSSIQEVCSCAISRNTETNEEQIPNSRFELSQFHSNEPSQAKGRTMATKHGNFIDGAFSFDPSFFNLSPREAKSMDPQQRVILQTALAAMEDAGYVENSTPTFQKDSFGCYVGVATGDYTDNLKNDIDVYYSPGTLRAFLSGKISYAFKLSGPSVVIDTACSGSIIAIYQACRALQNGDCNAAMAGGVNIISSPDMYLGLSRAHFLSTTGQCKPFDAGADGYSRAEGCGVFVLKRLSDAIAENDRIHGVIKGVEVNQCGNAHSITHPHAETQAALFRRLLKNTKTSPHSINVVEAHGTGTQAGDATEATSLQSVFGPSRPADSPLVVSSIKGNIGHCEAASGAAGLTKLLLMMRHGQIPLQASLVNMNPRVTDILTDAIKIPRQTLPWTGKSSQPRRALLNNFGAAGSNGALLLEEYIDRKPESEPNAPRTAYVFNISARSAKALRETVQRYRKVLTARSNRLRIQDICYTASARRQLYDYRLSLTCSSLDELLAKLETANADVPKVAKTSKPVIFVFSGQGSTYAGMAKELLETSALFKETVLSCDELLNDLGFPGVLRLLETKENTTSNEDLVVGFQCACVIFEYALAKLWMSWNVIPDLVVGHSLGEYAALAISGALLLEDVIRLVALRARLMLTKCAPNTSGMLACRLSPSQSEDVIKSSEAFSDLTVACRNSLGDCVIAGPSVQLDNFKRHCTEAGHKATKLSVPYGFHSAAMDPILEPLQQLGRSVTVFEPTISIGSGVTGTLMTAKDLDEGYFARHARQPVKFAELMQDLDTRGLVESGIFVEIGPHPITLPMVNGTLPKKSNLFLASLRKDRPSWASLCDGLGQLYTSKEGINWRQVFDGTQSKVIDLPGHPLGTTEYYIHYKENTVADIPAEVPALHAPTAYTLLPKLLPSRSTQDSQVFETNLDVLGEYIIGHAVGGIAICPASVYHEMVLEASQTTSPLSETSIYVVDGMVFASPLVYDSTKRDRPVRVFLTYIPGSRDRRFRVISCESDSTQDILHCSGTVIVQEVSAVRSKWNSKTAMIKRQEKYLFGLDGYFLNKFQGNMIYETIFPRVVIYAQEYQSLKTLNISTFSMEGHGTFKLRPSSHSPKTVSSHVFTDTLLHAAGFIANISVPPTEICICGKVGNLQLLYNDINYEDTFTVYCSLFDDGNGNVVADASALTPDGKLVGSIEGMVFKKLRLTSFRAHLDRTVGSANRQPPPMESVSGSQSSSSEDTLASTSGTPPAECDTPVPETVKTLMAQVISHMCNVPKHAMDATQDLNTLGINQSILSGLFTALKDQYPDRTLDQSGLIRCRTLQDLEDAIIRAYSDSSSLSNQLKKVGKGDSQAKRPPKPKAGKVRQVLKAVCEVGDSELPADRSLESLGIDSLMTIELEHALQKELGFKVSLDKIGDGLTVGDLEAMEVPAAPEKDDNPQPSASVDLSKYEKMLNMESLPVTLQANSSEGSALHLFHDGSGLCNMYARLGDMGRDVHGFFNPAFFDEEKRPKCLVEMASYYASLIKTPADSPVILGGWSFGGVVAFEVACQLRAAGREVSGVILIDSPYPVNHKPLPEEIIAHVAGGLSKSAGADAIRQQVLSQFRQNASMLGKYRPQPAGLENVKFCYLRSRNTFDSEGLCGVRYPWLSDQQERTDAINSWKTLVGQDTHVLEIPGNHFEVLAAENVGEMSKQLRKACELVDGGA